MVMELSSALVHIDQSGDPASVLMINMLWGLGVCVGSVVLIHGLKTLFCKLGLDPYTSFREFLRNEESWLHTIILSLWCGTWMWILLTAQAGSKNFAFVMVVAITVFCGLLILAALFYLAWLLRFFDRGLELERRGR